MQSRAIPFQFSGLPPARGAKSVPSSPVPLRFGITSTDRFDRQGTAPAEPGQEESPAASLAEMMGMLRSMQSQLARQGDMIEHLRARLAEKDTQIEGLQAALKAEQLNTYLGPLMNRVIPATVHIQRIEKYRPVPEDVEKLKDKYEVKTLKALNGLKLCDFDFRQLEEEWTSTGTGSGFWFTAADGLPRVVTDAHVLDLKEAINTPLGDIRVQHESVEYLVTPNIRRNQEAALADKKQEGYKMLLARTPNGRKPATTQGGSKGLDVAVLVGSDDFYRDIWPGLGIKPLTFRRTSPANLQGTPIMKVGNSGHPGNIHTGYVSQFETFNVPKDLEDGLLKGIRTGINVETSVSLNPGDSGGPMVDMQGRVVGVNRHVLNASKGGFKDGISYATAADTVVAVLQAWGFLARE